MRKEKGTEHKDGKSDQNLKLYTDGKHIHLWCYLGHNSKHYIKDHNAAKDRQYDSERNHEKIGLY